ncbi:hypothetical protein [Gallaecimonas mangrovi]|uniref:hypothetical protein n=1 Tax=Gallaecimonas mangrovi TaxID=2291597 RepID=UPI001260208F|nr:hypothetical protein [Gallaecimonas mangrovi]
MNRLATTALLSTGMAAGVAAIAKKRFDNVTQLQGAYHPADSSRTNAVFATNHFAHGTVGNTVNFAARAFHAFAGDNFSAQSGTFFSSPAAQRHMSMAATPHNNASFAQREHAHFSALHQLHPFDLGAFAGASFKPSQRVAVMNRVQQMDLGRK